MVKCYFGYYRFSIYLDFTWRNQKAWLGLGKNELRKWLIDEIRKFASFLKIVTEPGIMPTNPNIGKILITILPANR